jgi:hypothetical protein
LTHWLMIAIWLLSILIDGRGSTGAHIYRGTKGQEISGL